MKSFVYAGISNPSAALALNDQVFIVADDEVNQLFIFQRETAQPLQLIALSELFKGIVSDAEDEEIDLEGAAAIDHVLFWLGSHSTSRKAKQRPARKRLLALSLTGDAQLGFKAKAEGLVISDLIAAMIKDARFQSYDFEQAQQLAPKSIAGLSIEGLAATPAKTLLIGFRNPLIGGKIKAGRLQQGHALLVELLNPLGLIAGEAPSFADPIELNLKGHGIRDITWHKHNRYIIVAGPYHENIADAEHKREKTRLFRWSHKSGKVKLLKNIDLKDLNVEAALFYPHDNKRLQLLSDDGQQTDTLGFRSITLKL